MARARTVKHKARKTDELLHLRRGVDYLRGIQTDAGCWEGEVVWCPMLTAQYVIVAHVTGQTLPQEKLDGFARYFEVWQLEDGSWGMHAESPGYLFVTTLTYVALRLMGYDADHPMVARGRAWIADRGGPLAIPSWGKLWLAIMNLYGWEGVNPILPELWLLPEWSPIHPRRYYCHTRLIYLAIGVVYGQRFQHPEDALVRSLRQELYPGLDYAQIPFAAHRHDLHGADMFAWPTLPVKGGYELCRLYDKVAPKALRQKAMRACIERIEFEFASTRHACISPVNGLLNCLAVWTQDKNHPDFAPGFAGVDYWMWTDAQEGMRFNGARSQTWDTSFTVQAIGAGPKVIVDEARPLLERALRYLDEHQMQTEIEDRERWFRDRRLGGFCFSDKHHQWPVSDCTGEAIEALRLLDHTLGHGLPAHRLEEATRFLLTRQNDDGGWGSYERKRGNLILENLNPSEMFGNCMTERSYIECTASAIRGLAAYLEDAAPSDLTRQCRVAMGAGAALLRRTQLKDGSWPGFWGVNYTYGTLFGVQGLLDAGADQKDEAIQRAVAWFKRTQLADGGWGETWRSCVDERYIPSERGMVIQTAWAVMALIMAGCRDGAVIEPAVRLIKARQQPNGDWPKEGVGGVFFNTAMHHYCLYKNTFPVWALSLYESIIGAR